MLPDWTAPNIEYYPTCIPDKTTNLNAIGTSFIAPSTRSIVASNLNNFLSFAYQGI